MTAMYRWTTWTLAAVIVAVNVHAARAQTASVSQATRPAGGAAEGIGVHGYWVIDVKNRDGSLASHTEFENALTSDGMVALVKTLQGLTTFSALYVELDSSGQQPCSFQFLSLTEPSPCDIVPPGVNLTGVIFSSTN